MRERLRGKLPACHEDRSEQDHERRRYPRKKILGLLKYQRFFPDSGRSDWEVVNLSDISLGGLRFSMPEKLRVFSSLCFKLHFLDSDLEIIGIGQTKWILKKEDEYKPTYVMGLEFTQLSSRAFQKIRAKLEA